MIKLLNNWSSCLLFLSIKFIMISSCIRNNECDCVDLPFKGCFRAVVGLTHVSLHYQNNARAGPGCILDRPWPAFLQTLPIWYFQRFIGPCSFWWYASIRWFVIVLVVWWVCLLYSPLGEMVMASYSQCPHGIPCDNLHVFYASVIQRLRTSLYIWDCWEGDQLTSLKNVKKPWSQLDPRCRGNLPSRGCRVGHYPFSSLASNLITVTSDFYLLWTLDAPWKELPQRPQSMNFTRIAFNIFNGNDELGKIQRVRGITFFFVATSSPSLYFVLHCNSWKNLLKGLPLYTVQSCILAIESRIVMSV